MTDRGSHHHSGPGQSQDKSLARDYQKAAESDAYHERQANLPKSTPRYSDAELSGIESGETGEETRERDPTLVTTREVPDVPMKDVARPDEADGEAKGAARAPSRFTDAELSGLERGETSIE